MMIPLRFSSHNRLKIRHSVVDNNNFWLGVKIEKETRTLTVSGDHAFGENIRRRFNLHAAVCSDGRLMRILRARKRKFDKLCFVFKRGPSAARTNPASHRNRRSRFRQVFSPPGSTRWSSSSKCPVFFGETPAQRKVAWFVKKQVCRLGAHQSSGNVSERVSTASGNDSRGIHLSNLSSCHVG